MTKTKDPEAPRVISPDLDEIETAFSGLPSDAYIDVYRIDEQNNGKHAFVHRYTDPREFSPADLAAKAGGGRYRLYARGKNSKGVNQLMKSPELLIDRSIKPASGAGGTGGAPSGNVLTEVFSQQIMGQMLSMMQTTQQLNALALKSIAEGSSKESPADRILAAVLPAILKPATDPTELGIKIATLMKSESGGGSIAKQLGEMLDVVDKVRPLLGDGDDRAPPAIHPVVEGMRMAEGMLDKYLRIREGFDIAPAPPAPAPVTSGAEPPPAADPKPAAHPMIAALDRVMPLLLTGARKGADADDYVSLVLDNIEVEYHPALFTTLGNPTVLDELGRRYPDLLAFRPFFTELVRLIRDELGSHEAPPAAAPAP